MSKRLTQPKLTAVPASSALIAVRTPSGHLVGYVDRSRMVLQVKRSGRPAEEIDLRALLVLSEA